MSSSAALDGAELRVICGPTAAGKSALALALAERFAGTIISADSRQVYRGFDIGTAKPTAAERERVPHRGIDVVDPGVRYSAARWSASAAGWIDEAHVAGRTPVIVGGTGLYIRALVSGLFDEPELDPDGRARLQTVLAELTLDSLRRWCSELDPSLAHLGRAQLLRAIEIALLTGHRLSDLQRATARAVPLTVRYLVVDPGAVLASRIERRVDAMLAGGWIDEVRRLAAAIPADAPAWKASGYRWVVAFVNGEVDLETARTRIVIETRQYAKRQRTWFRHQLPAELTTRVSPEDPQFDRVAERWWGGERIT